MELKEVFEPVLNFIKSLQKKDKEPASKKAAKDRLKLVLMQDRASVSPDFFEIMKKEIIDVIKKYIEIDEETLEVQLTRGIEAGLEGPALYANIPIKNVKPVAPKMEGDDGEDEISVQEVKMALTEEEADIVADTILEHIENSANKDNVIAEDIVVEESQVVNEGNKEKKEDKEKNSKFSKLNKLVAERLENKEKAAQTVEEKIEEKQEETQETKQEENDNKSLRDKKAIKTRNEIEAEVLRRREAMKAKELAKKQEEKNEEVHSDNTIIDSAENDENKTAEEVVESAEEKETPKKKRTTSKKTTRTTTARKKKTD